MTDIATITWGDLERGMRIAGGWKVVDLTATHITVASEEDGKMSTFKRKDPWESVEVVPLTTEEVRAAVGGTLIEEEVDGEVRYFAWPDDRDFINAAQSHLELHHGIAVGDRSYDELRTLHEELHARDAGHTHINREDSSSE